MSQFLRVSLPLLACSDSKLHDKTSVVREDHAASLKVMVMIWTYAVNRQ